MKILLINNLCKILSSFLLVLFPVLVFAQDKGKVSDRRSGEAFGGVSISLVEDKKIVSITDDEGNYSLAEIKRLSDKDTLQFSHIGHFGRKISLHELRLLNYNVTLDEDVQSLEEVAVSVRKESPQLLLQYEKLALMPVGLHSFGSVMVDDKIYVAGGDVSYIEDAALKAMSVFSDNSTGIEDDFWKNFQNRLRPNLSWSKYNDQILIYDIHADIWTKSPLKTRARAYHSSNYFNGKIYTLGGKRLSTSRKQEYLDETIEAYDKQRDTVFMSNINPHRSINFASAVFEDNIIVMGGSVRKNANDQKIYSDKAYLFNLSTGLWYQLDDIPVAKESKGIVVGNEIYLVGGFKGGPLKDIDSYNLTTGEWTTVAGLKREVERPGLVYHAGIIYIFENGKIQAYNVETGEVNLYMVDLPFHSAELFYTDNKLYVVGGFRKDEYTIEPSDGVYSIDMDQFRKTRTYNEQ